MIETSQPRRLLRLGRDKWANERARREQRECYHLPNRSDYQPSYAEKTENISRVFVRKCFKIQNVQHGSCSSSVLLGVSQVLSNILNEDYQEIIHQILSPFLMKSFNQTNATSFNMIQTALKVEPSIQHDRKLEALMFAPGTQIVVNSETVRTELNYLAIFKR